MKPRGVILREVCDRLYALGLGRDIVRLLNRVYDRLETDAEKLRHNRVPGREACFRFRQVFVQPGTWYHFAFVVNDQETPGSLIVIDFDYESRSRPSGN